MSTEAAIMLTGRLLRVLREAARPMSTAELVELMPWKYERTVHGGCQMVGVTATYATACGCCGVMAAGI